MRSPGHLRYEFGRWQVDTLRRELRNGDRVVALFPRCFDALVLLLERRGELVAKDELMEALWPHVIVEENSLAKVISDIRRALGENSRSPSTILTVPRRGYRLAVPVRVTAGPGNREPHPEAFAHYIRGRYLGSKRTREAMLDGIRCLERSASLDPRFAHACAALADAWIQLGLRAGVSQSLRPREVMPKARAAAERALEIDPNLSEAHAALGHVLFVYEWQRERGLAELRHAIELDPDNAAAQHWYAMALGSLGRFDEALAQIRRALDIEQLSVMVNANVGFLLYRAGRLEEAVDKLRHTVAMEPGFAMTRYRLGLALEALGRHDEAIEQFERMNPGPDDPLGLTAIARTRALMGDTEAARRLLGEIETLACDTYVPASTIAGIHVALGDHERALDCLERSVDERTIAALWLPHERHWEPLRQHPRFRALLKCIP